jgi:hypothetical protein
MTDPADARRVAPAAERNKDALLNVLRYLLPAGHRVMCWKLQPVRGSTRFTLLVHCPS